MFLTFVDCVYVVCVLAIFFPSNSIDLNYTEKHQEKAAVFLLRFLSDTTTALAATRVEITTTEYFQYNTKCFPNVAYSLEQTPIGCLDEVKILRAYAVVLQ